MADADDLTSSARRRAALPISWRGSSQEPLRQALGTRVVENRPGAGGIVGVDFARPAPRPTAARCCSRR